MREEKRGEYKEGKIDRYHRSHILGAIGIEEESRGEENTVATI